MDSKRATRAALALALAAALALSACAATPGSSDGSASSTSSPNASATMPAQLEFTTTTLDGEPFDGASLSGKATILWFWAAWCPSCAADSKEILAAIPELPDGVQIIGVPTTADRASMQTFAEDFGITGLTNVVDEDGSIWAAFNIPQLPSTAMIYPDGYVATLPGSLTKDQLLEIAAKIAP